MSDKAEQEAALAELVRLSEEAGLYDIEAPVCHCGRVCCRHHETP